MTIRMHRNLHASRQGKPQWVETLRGRVQQYHPTMILTDVTTRVQRGGVAKCHETGVRRVCAFLDGVPSPTAPEGHRARLAFHPARDDEFLADGVPFNRAVAVVMNADGSADVIGAEWSDEA